MGGPAVLHKGSSDAAIPSEVGGQRSEVVFGLLAGPVSMFQRNGQEKGRKRRVSSFLVKDVTRRKPVSLPLTPRGLATGLRLGSRLS